MRDLTAALEPVSFSPRLLICVAALFVAGGPAIETAKDVMNEGNSDRPATFEAAFAADVAAADSQTAIPTTPETTPADATAQPGSVASPSTEGPIPFDRHKSALENARTKAREEALTEWRQKHGWAERLNREQIEGYAPRAAQFEADPLAWLTDYVAELQAHPQHGQNFRPWVARTLAGFRTPKDEAVIAPGIPVTDETGREIARTYTGEQIDQLIVREVQKAIGQEVTPLKQHHERLRAKEQQAEEFAQANESAGTLYQKALTWPGFKEHEQVIAEAFKANPEYSLYDAYIAVAVPKLQQTEQAKALETLEKKAAATGVTPGAAVVTTTHRPKSFHDAGLKWS